MTRNLPVVHSTCGGLVIRFLCLAAALAPVACGDSPTTPATAELRVAVTQSGNSSDGDGVIVEVTNQASGSRRSVPADPGDTVVLDELGAGSYLVRVAGLAEHCVAVPDEISVTLAGQAAEVSLAVDCVGQFAYARFFSQERQDVLYLDEHGAEHTLSQGGWDIPRDWSPDGHFLLVDRWIGDQCETWRVGLDGSVQQVLIGPSSVGNSQWSPSGDLIAVQYGSCADGVEQIDVVLLDAATLAPLDFVPNTTSELDQHPAWSPDGAEVAFVRSEHALNSYAVATRELREIAQLPRGIDFPVWSPDGDYIAVVAYSPQQLLILEAQSGEIVAATPDSIIAITAAWLPDGRTILFNGLQGAAESLYSMSLADGATRRFTGEVSGIVAAGLSVDPDARVLFVGRPTGTSAVFVADADGSNARQLRSGTEHMQMPVWRRTMGASASVAAMGAARQAQADRQRLAPH